MVALFHVIEKELEWRRANGRLEGFGTMHASKPIIAVGADHPLEDEILMADHFRMYQRWSFYTILMFLQMEPMAWPESMRLYVAFVSSSPSF